MMTKNELRKMIRHESGERAPGWFAARGDQVQERAMVLDAFTSARTVCIYLDVLGEVPTGRIVETCWEADRDVCVPAWNSSEREYVPAMIRRDTQLKKGKCGIMEPVDPAWVDCNDVTCFLVPGLAFDSECGRLGRGGGHYDRMLGSLSRESFVAVGLTFDFQVLDSVPQEWCDVRMDFVVTETRSISGG